MRRRTTIMLIFAAMAALFGITACAEAEVPPEKQGLTSEAVVYEAPEGADRFEGARVFVGDTEAFVYRTMVNTSQVWNGMAPDRAEAGLCYFDFSGKAAVTVRFDSLSGGTVVRPLAYGVNVTENAAEGSVSFTLTQPGNYVVEPDGDAKRALHLFANAMETDAPERGEPNVIYFGKGLHTAENSDFINEYNEVFLPSGTTVYIAGGAVVRARFVANGVSDITICGRGIIDGSRFSRTVGVVNTQCIPLEFNDCENVTLKDFILSDPAGWCVQYYFVNGGSIDNVRMISSRSNGDGISLQSCQNIEVTRAFVRSWDDSLVVKNYPRWYDKSEEGETRKISFSYCTLWTDLAQSMEVGYETVGKVMEDISFTDITVLHNFHKPVMSIHNANNADVKRVTFRNVTVEDARMGLGDAGANCQLIDFSVAYSAQWSNGHKETPVGSVTDVTVENVNVLSGFESIPVSVKGSIDSRDNSIHYIQNVTLKDVWIKGKPLTADDPYFTKNAYAVDVTVESGTLAAGAGVYMPVTAEALAKYGAELTVTVR